MSKCAKVAFNPGFRLFSRFPDECTGETTTCWWIITLWNVFQVLLTHDSSKGAYGAWSITVFLPFSQRLIFEWRYT